MLVGSLPSLTVNLSRLEGVSASAKQLKDTVIATRWCVSIDGDPGPCPKSALKCFVSCILSLPKLTTA